MSSDNTFANRTNRRAAAADKHISSHDVEIPLADPSRDRPTHQTLYGIALERQAQLQKGQPFAAGLPIDAADGASPSIVTQIINPDGSLFTGPDDTIDSTGPLGEAVIYALTLTMLHFTLDVLVHQQYSQSIQWDSIVRRTAVALPILAGLVYMFHPLTQKAWVQAGFLVVSVVAGCYMIYASNEEAYFAVMKRAPPLGTLWVWSVIEMRLEIAVPSLLVVGGFFWWGGFTVLS